jgi:hypothetical protein
MQGPEAAKRRLAEPLVHHAVIPYSVGGMFDGATRKALVISLVGGAILLYIVDPLLRFTPSLVLRVVGAISKGWTDSIFRDAAQPESYEPLSVLTIMLLTIVLMTLFTSAGRPAPETPWFSRAVIFFGWFLIIPTLLLYVILRDTSSSIERCFHTRLVVLSPHLSDHEQKELAASWMLMRSRADYDAIKGRLKEYAEKYNVVPVIKSLEETQQAQRRCI